MRGDDSSIHSISVHASGRYALTSSNSVAQLWDLDTFSRKRTLNGAQTVGIQQVRIFIVHVPFICFVLFFNLLPVFLLFIIFNYYVLFTPV